MASYKGADTEMFNKIYEELKSVPVTMILLAILYIMVVQLYKDHVSSSDFNSLRDQIYGVQHTLKADHLDTRIHQVETELFNLATLVSEKNKKGLPIDGYITTRIATLDAEDKDLHIQIANEKSNDPNGSHH